MPMYQDLGPGIGAGITQGAENFVGARRNRFLMHLQAQAANDEHLSHVLSNAVQYAFMPEGVSVPGSVPAQDASGAPGASATPPSAGQPGYRAPLPTPMTPDMGLFRTAMTNLGGASAMPVASPIPPAPGRRDVMPPDALFQNNMSQSFFGASNGPNGLSGTNAPGASKSAAGAGAANIPGRPQTADGGDAATVTAPPPTQNTRQYIPGVGSFDPFAGLARQIYLKRAETQLTTDEQIRRDRETGVVGRNLNEGLLAGRRAAVPMLGDPGYNEAKAQEAYGTAVATLPVETQKMITQSRLALGNATTVEQMRGAIQGQLQHNQQMFDMGKMSVQQKFDADQLATRLAGEFVNQSALSNQNHRSSVLGRITAAKPQTVAPSSQLTAPAPTEQQKLWDDAVKLHGAAKVLQEFGPRPE